MRPASSRVVLVVPCFNEAARFRPGDFELFFRDSRFQLLFVDDGSRDETGVRLRGFCARSAGRAQLLRLQANHGKGEAVRLGMLHALDAGAQTTGFTDADLATPPEELTRLCDVMDAGTMDAVTGARVAMLGAEIERRKLRHASGRIFATCVSLVLRTRVYDTQCGAKLFRASEALRAAIAEPFLSRWAFDVELIGRLLVAGQTIEEVPLHRWSDVPGTKLTPSGVMRAAADLLRIERDLRRRRTSP